MFKKFSKKSLIGFVSFPIILCLIVLSSIFLSNWKVSSYSNSNMEVISTAPAKSTVNADVGSTEAVLYSSWKNKLGINDSSYNYLEAVILTKNTSDIPDMSDTDTFYKQVKVGASDEAGTVYDETVDITAYITKRKPSTNSSYTYYTATIYSPKTILSPYNCTSLFSSYYINNITLKNFSTKNATNMSRMFMYYSGSKLDLSQCDFTTTNVENMSYMFAQIATSTAGVGDTYSLNFGSNFSTLKVKDMSYMFSGYGEYHSSSYGSTRNSAFTEINLAFSKFTTTNVENMAYMFYTCKSLRTLTLGNTFNTLKVTNMTSMFRNCTSLQQLNLSAATFNTSSVKNMSHMFEYSAFRTAGVGSQYGLNFGSNFDITNVTDLSYMFAGDNYYSSSSSYSIGTGANYLQEIDFTGWKVPTTFKEDFNVNFSYMFLRCGNLTKVNFSDAFYVDNVTNMQYMFWGCTRLTDLYFGKMFQPKKVTNFEYMFYYCYAIVGIDFTYFYTEASTNMQYMFYNCYNLTSLDLRAFNTMNVTNFSHMFAVESTVTSRLANLTLNFNTASARNMQYMFAYCSGLTSLELSSFNTTNATDMQYMFYFCSGLSGVGSNNAYRSFALNLGDNFYTINVTNMDHMFSDCSGSLIFELSVFNTSKVTNMTRMFYNCNNAKTITLGPTFYTNAISGSNMTYMFANCSSLNDTLDLSLFDTTRINNASYFMYNCAQLKHLLLGNKFTMENTTTLTHMFDGCGSLVELDVSMFNTEKVTDMSYLFSGCATLTELDLSSFNTSNVTTMWNMFSRCSSIPSIGVSNNAIQYALNLGNNFDTTKVTDMSSMFAYCSSATTMVLGDKFKTNNVNNIGSMFFSCSSLKEANAIKSFNVSNVKDMSSLFGFCSSLEQIDLSSFTISAGVVIVGIVDACTGLETINCPRINAENLTADLPTIYTPLKGSSQTFRQLSELTNGRTLHRAGNFLYTSFRVILGSELCQKVATLTVTSKLSQSTITKNKFVNPDQLAEASIGGVYSVGTANTSGTLYSNTSLLKAYMLKSDYVDDNGDIMYDCVIYCQDMIVYAPENSEYIFAGKDAYNSYFTNLRNVYLDGFDTSNATSLKGMFAECGELRYLDISNLRNTIVENYDDMLLNCRKLAYIYTFSNNGYSIQLPGAYYLKNNPSSTDEYREFPSQKTELAKRFSMVLDISNTDSFSASGWTITQDGSTAEKSFSYGDVIGTLPSPTKGSRVFTGWGTIVNDQFVPYNTKPGAIFESLEDIILVQSWAQVYVKFDLRDGFYDTGHVVSATETEETEFISELNNTRIVAERAIYTIKDIPANWSTIFDGTKILMYAGDNFGDLPSVYKDDHDLLGWKFLDGTFALSNTHVPTDDDAGVGEIGEVQLYADWIFAEHPEKWRFITFDANGGRIDAYRSVSVSTSVVSEYDEETDEFKYVTKLILDITNSNPQWDISESRSQTTKKYYVGRLADIMPYSVNAGYSFAGWWTAKDGGELIESSSTIVDTATVYAHWQKVDEDYSINQQTLIIVAIIVVVIVIGAIVIFLLKKSFIGSRKVITINEKFIENFNKDNIKEKPDLEDINNKIDDSSTKQ